MKEDEALELIAHARWRRAIRHPTKWDWSDFLGEALDRFVNLDEYLALIALYEPSEITPYPSRVIPDEENIKHVDPFLIKRGN